MSWRTSTSYYQGASRNNQLSYMDRMTYRSKSSCPGSCLYFFKQVLVSLRLHVQGRVIGVFHLEPHSDSFPSSQFYKQDAGKVL